jgi:hypothetical protein
VEAGAAAVEAAIYLRRSGRGGRKRGASVDSQAGVAAAAKSGGAGTR